MIGVLSLYCLLTSLLLCLIPTHLVLCSPQPLHFDIQPQGQAEELARYGSSTTFAEYLISLFDPVVDRLLYSTSI